MSDDELLGAVGGININDYDTDNEINEPPTPRNYENTADYIVVDGRTLRGILPAGQDLSNSSFIIERGNDDMFKVDKAILRQNILNIDVRMFEERQQSVMRTAFHSNNPDAIDVRRLRQEREFRQATQNVDMGSSTDSSVSPTVSQLNLKPTQQVNPLVNKPTPKPRDSLRGRRARGRRPVPGMDETNNDGSDTSMTLGRIERLIDRFRDRTALIDETLSDLQQAEDDRAGSDNSWPMPTIRTFRIGPQRGRARRRFGPNGGLSRPRGTPGGAQGRGRGATATQRGGSRGSGDRRTAGGFLWRERVSANGRIIHVGGRGARRGQRGAGSGRQMPRNSNRSTERNRNRSSSRPTAQPRHIDHRIGSREQAYVCPHHGRNPENSRTTRPNGDPQRIRPVVDPFRDPNFVFPPRYEGPQDPQSNRTFGAGPRPRYEEPQDPQMSRTFGAGPIPRQPERQGRTPTRPIAALGNPRQPRDSASRPIRTPLNPNFVANGNYDTIFEGHADETSLSLFAAIFALGQTNDNQGLFLGTPPTWRPTGMNPVQENRFDISFRAARHLLVPFIMRVRFEEEFGPYETMVRANGEYSIVDTGPQQPPIRPVRTVGMSFWDSVLSGRARQESGYNLIIDICMRHLAVSLVLGDMHLIWPGVVYPRETLRGPQPHWTPLGVAGGRTVRWNVFRERHGIRLNQVRGLAWQVTVRLSQVSHLLGPLEPSIMPITRDDPVEDADDTLDFLDEI